MKQHLQIILNASAASILASAALAQEPSTPRNTDRPAYVHEGKPLAGKVHAQRANRLNGAAKASDLIGMTVKNYQDEKLGEVKDFAVDVESGRIVQVILSTGGFIGIGDTLTAVPPGALHHDVAQKVVHLDANKEKLSGAPKFEMSKWAECCDSEHLSAVYRHYGEESAFKFVHRGDALLDGRRNAADQRRTVGSPNTVSTRKADGTWDKNRLASEDQCMIPAARLGQVQKASKLMGMSVQNLQAEKLGDVQNLLVDLSAGRVVAVIVSSGGFLGIAD